MVRLESSRELAKVALLLVLSCLAVPAFSQDTIEPKQADTSVFLAKLVSNEPVPDAPCASRIVLYFDDDKEPSKHCWASIYDMTVQPIEHVSGTEVARALTFRHAQHSPYQAGRTLVIATRKNEKGEWELLTSTEVRREACFEDPDAQLHNELSDGSENWLFTHDQDQTCIMEL